MSEIALNERINNTNLYTQVYNINIDRTKKLYDIVDTVTQHAYQNALNYDARIFLPAQEILQDQIEHTVYGSFFKLTKPIIVRVCIKQVEGGNTSAIYDLVKRLKSNAKWTVTPIKDNDHHNLYAVG